MSMTNARSSRRWKGERGAELIEFALVFPLLMMVVLGTVDFAFVFQRNEVVTNAAREGARVGTLPGYGVTDIENRVNEYLAAGGIPPGDATVTVTATTIPDGTGTWDATTVDVVLVHDYMFIDGVFFWISGFTDVTLQGTATMRNELGS